MMVGGPGEKTGRMEVKQFALLAETFESPPAEILAPLLQEALGVLPYEALRAARSARGILAERLEEGQAERIRRALQDGGIPCRVAPQEGIPPLYRGARSARALRLRGDSFQFRSGITGPWVSLSWDRLFLLSAGVVLEGTGGGFRSQGKQGGKVGVGGAVRLMVDPVGGALSILKKSRPSKGMERRKGVFFPHPMADLFFQGEGGEGGWIRLRGREVSYEGVLEGAEKGEFFQDFRELLWKLAERADPDRVTRAASALLEAGLEDPPLEGDAFFGEEPVFRLYNRWALACVLSAGD